MSNKAEKTNNVFLNRNFRLVFFGALVSDLGATLYSFAVSFYILEISGNNAFLQGLYLALCGIAVLLFTLVGGVLGDRVSKSKIMYVCDYLKGGMILLATLLMWALRIFAKILFDVFCRNSLRQTQCCQQQKQGKFLHIIIVFMVHGVHVVWYAHQFRHKGTKKIAHLQQLSQKKITNVHFSV